MKILSAVNQYAKLIVAALSAGGTFLETMYPGNKWAPAVTAAVGALLVYLVPNTQPPATATDKPKMAAPPATPPAA